MKEILQDSIDSYLLNRMSKEERQEFERNVQADPELMDQLEFSEDVISVMKSRSDKLAAIHEWREDAEKQRPAKFSNKKIFLWISGVAAVLIAGLFLFVDSPKENIYEKQFVPGADERVLSEPLKLEKESYSDICASLKGDRFSEALALIQVEEQELALLKIQALIGLGRYNEAQLLLKPLMETGSIYKQQADSLYLILKKSIIGNIQDP